MASSADLGHLHLPTRDMFIEDFLAISEGYSPEEEAERTGYFDLLIKSFTDEDERKVVNFLHAEYKRLHVHFWRRSAHFTSLPHLVSFISGLVKYLPTMLLNQMAERPKRVPHRLAAIQLLHLLTASLYPTPNRLLYVATFFTATKDAHQFSALVFKAYCRAATRDRNVRVRRSYLDLVEQLLINSDDGQVPCWLLHNFARRLHVDPDNELRTRALTILNDLFTDSSSVPALDSLLDEELLDRLALAALNEEKRLPDVQTLALIVATKAYISLMRHCRLQLSTPLSDRRPDALGRLSGILFLLYEKEVGPRTRAILRNFLRLIKLFLEDEAQEMNHPVHQYFEHPLMQYTIV